MNKTRLLVALAIIAILSILPATAVLAQDGMPDCSDCKITKATLNGHTNDQANCPGANKVRCKYQYVKQTKAECIAPGVEKVNCKPAKKKVKYKAKKFVGVVCGTVTKRDAKGRAVKTSCGTPTGGVIEKERSFAYCKGDDWNPSIMLALDEVFEVEVSLANGLTLLPDSGFVALDSTVLKIPTNLLVRGRDEGLIVSVDGFLYVTLDLSAEGPTRFLIPDQSVAPAVAEGNPIILGAFAMDGTVMVDLAIPEENLGAFSEYGVDLAGLIVETGPEVDDAEAAEDEDEDMNPDYGNDDTTLTALVGLTSAGEALTGGARAVARLASEAIPDEEPLQRAPVPTTGR